jgi:ribonuclease Z
VSHLFEPRLVNDVFGDPGLYVDFRDQRRAILFDVGDIRALAPRSLMRVSHVFVTHTHMDHFAGFDDLLRTVLGRKERIVYYGGPGFVDQVEHKLRAYTWNVVHRYETELVIEAREVDAQGCGRSASFSSRRRFEREAGPSFAMPGDVLHEEPTFRVRARFVDHEMPCLSLAIEETAHVHVARDRIEALGVTPGPWLRALKEAVLRGAPDSTTIDVRWRDREGAHEEVRTVGELRGVILEVVAGMRVGYATDLRYTEANVAALEALFAGVDRLYIESVFLDEDRDHAARKNHLTARQAGAIARRVGARSLIPFHFSPRYEGRAADLEAEAIAAWKIGDVPRFLLGGTK